MANEPSQIITPEDVAREFGIPVRTQHVWRYRNAQWRRAIRVRPLPAV